MHALESDVISVVEDECVRLDLMSRLELEKFKDKIRDVFQKHRENRTAVGTLPAKSDSREGGHKLLPTVLLRAVMIAGGMPEHQADDMIGIALGASQAPPRADKSGSRGSAPPRTFDDLGGTVEAQFGTISVPPPAAMLDDDDREHLRRQNEGQ